MEKVISTCYHCGSKCSDQINIENKVFCCEGCKTVFTILSENGMNKFYELNANAGLRSAANKHSKYNFLDLDEIRNKLILFSDDNITRVRLYLPQIHCSSCLYLLERLHKINPSIIQSEVSFNQRQAEITFREDQISLRELAGLLSSIGYAPDFSLQEYDQPKKKSYNKRLIVQIGVVGFCFGNIMLFSFPEYIGITSSFKNFQNTFNYLNLILSIPVLLFGARDYITSSYKVLKAHSVNIDVPITLGIFALYFRSVYEVLMGVGAGYFDSFAGLIFFLLIGRWFQRKTYDAINFERDYKSYFPIATSRLKGEEEEVVPLKNVEAGDRLMIRNNEMIPADSVLVKGDGKLDYSFVSGESDLISKYRGDHLYAGGKQMGTAIEVEVVKDVENSYLTRLWNNPIFHKKKQKYSRTDAISKYFTIGVIAIAIIVGGVWLYIDPTRAPFVVTSVLIVACPCALALSVPFTHGNLIRILGRRSLYLRSTEVLEPITEITDIIFDKTGTLTLTENAKVQWNGDTLSSEQFKVIYTMTKSSSHPLSRRIHKHLTPSSEVLISNYAELNGKGLVAHVGEDIWKMGSALWLGIASNSKRTEVFVMKNDELLGLFEFGNTYRPGIEKTMAQLGKSYSLHILSGDNDAENSTLKSKFGDEINMCFDQSPEDKLRYIKSLQDKGKKIMMVGDGLNDAGALMQADTGIAVVDDVYAFSPASDGIIDGSKLNQLKSYINFAEFGKRVVWMSYGFSLMYNIIGLYFAVTGQLTPLVAAILMPLSSISVLAFVTAMTNIKGRKIH